MNERTGRNRRWLQSRNPALEALEARLVLSEAARLGLQPLLAHAGQLGKAATAGVTIDSVVGTSIPKNDSRQSGHGLLAISQPADPGDNSDPPPASPQFLSQDSATEGRAAVVQQPISQSIEGAIIGSAPTSATEAALALANFATKLAAAFDGEPLANPTPALPPPIFKHVAVPTDPPAPRGGETGGASQTGETPNSGTAQPAEPTPPPERAAPEPPNATVGLVQAVASAEQAPAAPPLPAPPQYVEAVSRQGTPPLVGQVVSNLASSSRFVDGYALQPRIHEAQELPAADFAAFPVDEATQGSTPSLIERLALRLEEDPEAPPAPLSRDLILNFLPCNVAALRTAIENFLTESEQVLLSEAPREGLALGMLIAALATSGMAGHAAWECLRGPRERTASLAWPDGGFLTRRDLAAGLQLSEMP
jgi:hypothetical protein